MAIGWLWLYSRYRKKKREIRSIEFQDTWASEICSNCGHPRFRHAGDQNETCPFYLTD
jgi:hypothetical protein